MATVNQSLNLGSSFDLDNIIESTPVVCGDKILSKGSANILNLNGEYFGWSNPENIQWNNVPAWDNRIWNVSIINLETDGLPALTTTPVSQAFTSFQKLIDEINLQLQTYGSTFRVIGEAAGDRILVTDLNFIPYLSNDPYLANFNNMELIIEDFSGNGDFLVKAANQKPVTLTNITFIAGDNNYSFKEFCICDQLDTIQTGIYDTSDYLIAIGSNQSIQVQGWFYNGGGAGAGIMRVPFVSGNSVSINGLEIDGINYLTGGTVTNNYTTFQDFIDVVNNLLISSGVQLATTSDNDFYIVGTDSNPVIQNILFDFYDNTASDWFTKQDPPATININIVGDCKKVQINANANKVFEAGVDVTQGLPVRLYNDGKVYPLDYEFEGVKLTNTFGISTSEYIYDVAHVSPTQQILAVGKVSGGLGLYVGNIDTTTNTIAWSTSTLISTFVPYSGAKAKILYNDTMQQAVVAFPYATGSFRIVSINKSGTTYTVGADQQISGISNADVFDISSNATNWFLGTRDWTTSIGVLRMLQITGSVVTTVSTSPNFIGLPTSFSIAYYKPSKVAIVVCGGGSVWISNWDYGTNTIASNVTVFTTVGFTNPIIEIFNGVGVQDFYGTLLSDNLGHAFKFTYTTDNSVTSLSNSLLYSAGTASAVGIWKVDDTNIFTSIFSGGAYLVTRIDYTDLLDPANYFVYGNIAQNGYIGDGLGTYYGVGYVPSITEPLFYQALGLIGITDYPILGITQESILTGATGKVAIENQISNVHTGLSVSDYYYTTDNGTITTTETENLLGLAISSTEINLVGNSSLKNKVSTIAIIDNTIADPLLITEVGRYIVPTTGTSGVFIGQENKYADYNGIGFVFSNPIDLDTVTILQGTNAGQVWKYNVNIWEKKSQTTGLPIYNWELAKEHKLGELVIYNNTIYQANADMPINTAFTIGTTGLTWRAITQGVLQPASQKAEGTKAGHISTNTTWQNLASITITEAGVYDLSATVNIMLQYNHTAEIRLTKNGASIDVNVHSIYHNAGTTGAQVTQIMPIERQNVTLSVGDVVAFQVRSAFATATVYNNATNYPMLNARKVSGYVPATGTYTESTLVTRTGTSQAITAVNQTIIFNTIDSGNIPYNTTTGGFTLTAGRKYELASGIGHDGNVGGGFIDYQWFDVTNNVYIGSRGGSESLNNNTAWGVQTMAYANITPSTNILVELRCVGRGVTASVRFNYSWAKVEQMGTTNVSQFVGVLSNLYNIGNTYPQGTIVIKDSGLYQANSTIMANTPFVLGTSGSTWTQVGVSNMANIRIATTSQSILSTDHTVVFNGTTLTATLGSPIDKRILNIKNINASTLSVTGNIDGVAQTISIPTGESRAFHSNTLTHYII